MPADDNLNPPVPIRVSIPATASTVLILTTANVTITVTLAYSEVLWVKRTIWRTGFWRMAAVP